MKYIEGYKYRKNGYNYEVVYRDQNVAISVQDGKFYEVFEVKKIPEKIMFGNLVEAHEAIPGDEQWGKIAFTCYTFGDALLKLVIINNLINSRK